MAMRKTKLDTGKGPPRTVTQSHAVAAAFLEADIDGDKLLSFDQFASICPESQSSKDEIRAVFESIDHNGSGDISLDEYFLWTLQVAVETSGVGGLMAIFQHYDKSPGGKFGEARLDSVEFSRAVEDMGFGSLAHELFLELDHDGSGSISYAELEGLLKARSLQVGKGCQQFLTALAYSGHADGSAHTEQGGASKGVDLDPGGWRHMHMHTHGHAHMCMHMHMQVWTSTLEGGDTCICIHTAMHTCA